MTRLTHVTPTAREVTATTFRESLGHFCTGITVITAMEPHEEGPRPVGFACQSFSSVSLDPPMVLFCPARTSRTWPAIERAGSFAVNILAWDQAEVSSVFGRGAPDKFAHVSWAPAPCGAPVLTDCLTWLDADIDRVIEAGDHYVVLGRVRTVGASSENRPLLFHRSRYSRTEVEQPSTPDWSSWPHPEDWI